LLLQRASDDGKLLLASKYGMTDVVEKFLEKEINPNAADEVNVVKIN